jgi:hypothetical protein
VPCIYWLASFATRLRQQSKQNIFFEKNQAGELVVLLKKKNLDQAIQQRNNESQEDQATKKCTGTI